MHLSIGRLLATSMPKEDVVFKNRLTWGAGEEWEDGFPKDASLGCLWWRIMHVNRIHWILQSNCRTHSACAGSHGALGKLEKMGFPKDAFFGAITSGEVCHEALQNRPDDFYRALGKRCVHITWGARGSISLGDLDLQVGK